MVLSGRGRLGDERAPVAAGPEQLQQLGQHWEGKGPETPQAGQLQGTSVALESDCNFAWSPDFLRP